MALRCTDKKVQMPNQRSKENFLQKLVPLVLPACHKTTVQAYTFREVFRNEAYDTFNVHQVGEKYGKDITLYPKCLQSKMELVTTYGGGGSCYKPESVHNKSS